MASSSSFLIVLGFFVSVINCYGQVLFPFGDSNYDPGNKQFLTTGDVASTFWPYGKSIDKPTGRWSDGRIVPDFISEFLSIPNIPPVLDPKANVSNGVSFATTDATVLGTPSQSLSLADQVTKFNQLKGKWSAAQREAALYLFYIGANDYLSYTNTRKNPTQREQENFVNQVVGGIEKDLVALYKAGARRFGFQNLAPLGCLPIVKQQYKSGTKCVPLPSNMAALHNKKLTQTLQKLEETLDAFHYAIFDYYNSTLRRISDPTHYRYFSANISCCGVGSHNAYGCGFRNVHSNLCSYQRGYLFYDGRHNAEKSNEAMAHLMWSADPEVIEPMNLRELFVFPANLSIII